MILDGVAKCIICQEDKSETLKSVLKAGNEAFYSSVLTKLMLKNSVVAIDILSTNVYFGEDINFGDLKP